MNKSAATTKLNNSNNNDSNMRAQAQASSSRDNAQQIGRVIRVPTFPSSKETGSGGSSNTSAEDNNITDLRSQDPFLYFSDQRRRMAHLTGNEEEVNDQDNPPQQQQRVVERRTRISFEVHPSLLFDDLFNNAMEVEEEEEEG